MKKVVVFGASGHTGKYIMKQLASMEDVELTAFVRNPSKLEDLALQDVNLQNIAVWQGDALNASDVKRAMDGQEVLLCSLEGDVLTMAENIVAALAETGVKRIIWITGMGIHHEIRGVRGMMLNVLAKSRPEYIKAADMIAASGAVYTLLRCPMIQDGNNERYYLAKEGEQPRNKNIDRAGIAKCMADMLCDASLGCNESLSITN